MPEPADPGTSPAERGANEHRLGKHAARLEVLALAAIFDRRGHQAGHGEQSRHGVGSGQQERGQHDGLQPVREAAVETALTPDVPPHVHAEPSVNDKGRFISASG